MPIMQTRGPCTSLTSSYRAAAARRPAVELGAHGRGVGDQAFVVDDRQGGQAGGHGQGIGAVGRVVDQHAVHRGVHPLEDRRRAERGPDRHEPA